MRAHRFGGALNSVYSEPFCECAIELHRTRYAHIIHYNAFECVSYGVLIAHIVSVPQSARELSQSGC